MDKDSFLFRAMVFLLAAVVMVPIAKKAGLGSVLGYLLAGVIIGPAVLSFVGHEGEDIMHYAEFGVVMMLFVIGLEPEPQLLWKLRKSIIGMGGLQVVATALVCAAIAMAFGLIWQQALAPGFILSLSSTAIVLQTLTEKGLMKTAAGQSAFSVLLFQDIAVIPILALLPLISTGATHQSETAHATRSLVDQLSAPLQTIILLTSVAAIVIAGRYLVRPLLRMIAATRLREILTATALLLVVGIAVLMTFVGLSPALGTFLAGVVLADSEYKHELESDIEPFKGLLLGLFFIAVGASINFDLILQQPLLVGGLVLLLILVKSLVLFAMGRLFNLKFDQNILLSFALSQVGEFAFVLFSFAGLQGILPESLIDLMTAVVAMSMARTPLLMLVDEKWLQPRFGTPEMADKPVDSIDEQHNVIIAGFGHFGSTIGRFLRAHQIQMTILDSDSDRVDLLRKMGFKVYYGDASRLELLHAAGAAKAQLIILALEPAEKRLELIETIKKHFPNLRMLVRASNRYDAYDLMNAGMLHIYRESLDTALRVGVDAMTFLGYRNYTAQRAARIFMKVDEANLKRLASIKDDEEYILTARAKIEELEKTLQQDISNLVSRVDKGWDEEGLIKEATESKYS